MLSAFGFHISGKSRSNYDPNQIILNHLYLTLEDKRHLLRLRAVTYTYLCRATTAVNIPPYLQPKPVEEVRGNNRKALHVLVSPIVAMWPCEVDREGDLKKTVLAKKKNQ